MILNYRKSQSSVYPELIDTTSSKKYVYLRKNVVEVQSEDLNEEIYTTYEYDEAKLTKEEYEQYLKELSVLDIQQQRADIDYILFMTGLEVLL